MLAAPPEIGPYRVLGPLGQGGMGTVWLAEDPRLGRRVAIKLFAGPEARTEYARDQLLREARAAAALSHANIAAVHDVVDVDGQVAVVFEYVEGETLAARIARGPLPITAALGVALQLTDALCAAHEQGIVHRDLKPPNIVVTRDGGIKVLDFGVARVLPAGTSGPSGSRTTAAGFVGTIGYAAPEQCLGEAGDARADIFSLGVVIYEALTGERPFSGADATTVMRAILQDPAPHVAARVRSVPGPLDGLIAQMLAAEPAKRPQTAREIRAALQAMSPATAGRTAAPAPRRRAWATAAVLSVALLTGALVSSLTLNRSAPTVAKPPVVAVMPLLDVSADPGNDYLAIGVADSLVTRLASLPSITVLSRSAVADARRRIPSIPALAAELDATYFVDGTVQKVADGVRISLSLLRANGSVVWADQRAGPFDDIFSLQSSLASALGQALSVQLSAADRAGLTRQPTLDAAALAAYWRGKAFLERRDIKGNLNAALAAFDEAVRLDPRFADAHAGRGEALWSRYGESGDPAFADRAISANTDALRHGPERAEVRYSLALTLAGTGRLAEAVEELQHALALRPTYDDARRELGQVRARQGQIDDAVLEFEKAIVLRPQYWGHYNALGRTLLQAARYSEAAAAFRRVVELQPDSFIGYAQLGVIAQSLGDYDEALAHYARAIERGADDRIHSNVGAIQHQRGDYRKAVDAYREALKSRPNVHVIHRNLGDAFARLGNAREARRAYERAAELAQDGLAVNPNDVNSLSPLAVYLAKLGRKQEALAASEKARKLAPEDVNVLLKDAVVFALCGMPAPAIATLKSAVQKGLSPHRVVDDDDLATLRSFPEFKVLVRTAH